MELIVSDHAKKQFARRCGKKFDIYMALKHSVQISIQQAKNLCGSHLYCWCVHYDSVSGGIFICQLDRRGSGKLVVTTSIAAKQIKMKQKKISKFRNNSH